MFRLSRRSSWWGGMLAAGLGIPVLAGVFVSWRASHATREAAAEVLANSTYRFRVMQVDRAIPPGVDVLPAVPGFRDVVPYQDKIIVSARAGVFVYGRDGALLRTYRTGLELPPAEPGSMSVGIGSGSAEREVFIATRGEGLLAFNGSRFRQVLPDDAGKRNLTSVLVLSSGQILIGTDRNGLLSFDGRRLTAFHTRLNSSHITALTGTDGDLWIGTLSDGLFHYQGGELEELASALPDPQILSLSIRNGAVYAGTPLGVVEFRDGRKTRPLADGFFARAVAAVDSALYVGTEDEGIVEVPQGSRPVPPVRTGAGAPAGPIVRIVDLDGQVYAVTETAIYRFDRVRKRWDAAISAGTTLLADRNVAALGLSGGRLWVGYFDRGLDVIDAGLDRAEHFENDRLFCINRIVADPEHARTAVATANGLVLFDAGTQPRQVMGKKEGLLSDHVTDVAFREGGMVVATSAGLSFVDHSGVRSLYVFHGLVNNHVYTVATRGSETLAGTLGGISVLHEDSVLTNYTTANSHLKHNWITALVRLGDEWLAGTYGSGVLRLDRSGEWHGFSDLPAGLVVNPNAIVVSGGRVYAGSLDRGLFVLERASGRWTNVNAGLPSTNVTALAAEGGYLYVGTDNGVVRIAEGVLQ